MYNRLYSFLKNKELIYFLQFGVGKEYSITHTIIHLINIIKVVEFCGLLIGISYRRSPYTTEN